MKKHIITAALSLMLSAPIFAEEAIWSFAARVSSIGIDSDTATKEGIDDVAFGFGLDASYAHNKQWFSTLGFDFIGLGDNNEFQQRVSDGRGRTSVESSEASAMALSVASGYQWFLGKNGKVNLKLEAGYTQVVAAERSIFDCNDCFEESIDLDGGVFIRGTTSVVVSDTWSINLFLQPLISGDGLTSVAGITFASGF